MTNNRSRHLALFFFVLACGEAFALTALAPLDVAVYNWIELHRSCAATRLFLFEWPLVLLIVPGALVLLWLCHQQRWTEAIQGGTIVILGSFLGELLKTAFERARPTALPPLFTGNSFPSGHAIGATLLAGTLGYFLLQQQLAVWKKALGVITLLVCVATVLWQRLYLMHHWVSDIVGSTLLASTWLCFALARPIGRSAVRHFAPACVGLLGAYPLFYYFPAARVVLPVVKTTAQEPLLTFSARDVTSAAAFQGAWGPPMLDSEEPGAWMLYGEANLAVQLPHRQAYTVQFAARPPDKHQGESCLPLEVSVNQQFVQRFLLQGGWRHYEFRLDPSLIQVGSNALTFRTEKTPPLPLTSPREAVAFQTLLLFAEGQ